MIPTVEDILKMLLARQCTHEQAMAWMEEHFASAIEQGELQSLSQEAVRDEALDQGFAQGKKAAVKVCEECRVLILGDPTAKQGAVMIARETGRDLARQIEALKREPNAAAPGASDD